ncbi:MAG: hypothetical protein J7L26_03600 [Candidatus Aminicenantes bacterium]|nr:hypothetical protein [Candidatus Aminicenantes bacterium]
MIRKERKKETIRKVIEKWHKDLFIPGSSICCISSSNSRKDIQLIDTWLFKKAIEFLISELEKEIHL